MFCTQRTFKIQQYYHFIARRSDMGKLYVSLTSYFSFSLLCINKYKYKLRPDVVHGHKRVIVNATGGGFDFHSREWSNN